MNDYLLHQNDVNIIRNQEHEEDYAILYDSDGDRVFTFPAGWTDEMILIALSFANKAYATGVCSGLRKKASEIRSALFIQDGAL